MLFLQYIVTNLVLTKSSGPKSHAVSLTDDFRLPPIFAGFCVYYTDLSGGGPVAIATFPPPPAPPAPPAANSAHMP
jgi:hypothetical protein